MAKHYLKPELVEKQRKRDYKHVFSSQQGKSVLSDLCDYHNVYHPLTADSLDPCKMAFNEGMRTVVMRIIHLTESDPDQVRQETAYDG